MSTTDQWFYWVSVGYLVVLLGSSGAAIWLWKLNDDHELGTKNRPVRIKANVAVLTLAMIGAFASIVLFFLSQRANSEAAAKTEEARVIANGAQKQAGQALKDAGEANERAGRATERAAKLEKEAADARLEQERLKAQLAWRALNSETFQRLVAGLRSGSGSLTLGYSANDPEGLSFAIQISQAIQQSQPTPPQVPRWNVVVEPRIDTKNIIWGIFIPGPENSSVRTVRNAFTYAGIPFSTADVPVPIFEISGITSVGNSHKTDVFIMIGSKRPPI